MSTPDLLSEIERLLALCRTPASADLPPDTEYARLSRRARQEAFHEAYFKMKAAQATASALSWASVLAREPPSDDEWAAARMADHCAAAFLRAPAGSRADLDQKKKLARWLHKFGRYGHFPMTAEEAAACIDRDVAWLEAHPVRTRAAT